MAVFGECGQGKSTLLNEIVEVYKDLTKIVDSSISFDASKSLDAVTSLVRIATLGKMTLVDTPGFNDPNKTRSDKHIHMEFVETVREALKS